MTEKILVDVAFEVKKRAQQKMFECYLTSVISFLLMAVVLVSAAVAMYAAFTHKHELDENASLWVGYALIAEILIHGFTDWKHPLQKGEKFARLAALAAQAVRQEPGPTVNELRMLESELGDTGAGPLMKAVAYLWNKWLWRSKSRKG